MTMLNARKTLLVTFLVLSLLVPVYSADAVGTSPSPTPVASATPTVSPKPTVTPKPSATPTVKPTVSPKPTVSASPSPTPVVTDIPAPVRPGIVASLVGKNILVSWTLPKKLPKKQTLSISPLDGFTTKGGVIDLKNRNYTFTNATLGKTYNITLTTTTPKYTYKTSVVTVVAPGAPTNLRASRIGDGVALFWDRYAGDSSGLNSKPDSVLITLTSPDTQPVTYEGKATTTTYRIESASRAYNYTVQLQYKNSAGLSEPVATTIAATVPNQPSKPTTQIYNTSSLKLSWTYEGPNITGQSVRIISSTGSKRNGEVIEVRSMLRDFLVTDLSPGAKYSFEIILTNRDGSSKPIVSDPVSMLLPPAKPMNLKAKAADLSAILTWEAPVDNGGTPVTGYKIEYRAEDTPTYTSVVSNSALTKTIPGLINSKKYLFRVYAITSFATGEVSNEVSVIPAALPGPVTSLAAVASTGSIRLTWVAPLKDGGLPITSYLVTYKTPTDKVGQIWPSQGTALSVTLSGLTDGIVYTFIVQAVTDAGNSAAALVSATPYSNPGVPNTLVATPGNAKINIAWKAPASFGGLVLSSYSVQYKLASDGAWTSLPTPTTALTRDITGLVNGLEYQVRVAATTGTVTKITGEYSAPVSATPVTVPGAVTGLTVTPGNLSAHLSWVAPASTGGSALTGYKVEYKASSSAVWIQTPSNPVVTNYTIESLISGTTYNFRVTALNAVGVGVVSPTVNAIPSTLPNAPATLTAALDIIPVAGQVKLSWTEPASSGVSPITGYKIQYKLTTASEWTTANASILALSYTLTGLSSAVAYDIQVSSINAIGVSLPRATQIVTA